MEVSQVTIDSPDWEYHLIPKEYIVHVYQCQRTYI
jgi:hypothetical protein